MSPQPDIDFGVNQIDSFDQHGDTRFLPPIRLNAREKSRYMKQNEYEDTDKYHDGVNSAVHLNQSNIGMFSSSDFPSQPNSNAGMYDKTGEPRIQMNLVNIHANHNKGQGDSPYNNSGRTPEVGVSNIAGGRKGLHRKSTLIVKDNRFQSSEQVSDCVPSPNQSHKQKEKSYMSSASVSTLKKKISRNQHSEKTDIIQTAM